MEARQERRRCIDKTCESKTNLTMFHLSWNQRKKKWKFGTWYVCVSCHLLDRKDHQHVLNYSGPAEAYQPTDVREWQNMWRLYTFRLCRQSAVQPRNTAVSWVCALSRTEGSVDVWSSDQGFAQVSDVGVWFWRSITADWTWYVPHCSSYK